MPTMQIGSFDLRNVGPHGLQHVLRVDGLSEARANRCMRCLSYLTLIEFFSAADILTIEEGEGYSTQ